MEEHGARVGLCEIHDHWVWCMVVWQCAGFDLGYRCVDRDMGWIVEQQIDRGESVVLELSACVRRGPIMTPPQSDVAFLAGYVV